MKNFDTVQLLIIIVAMIAGYHAMIEIPQFLWLIMRWFGEGLTLAGHFSTVVTSLIYLSINIVSVIILVSRSKQLAWYIIEKSEYKGELSLSQSKDDLLSVVFIAMGVYILVTRLPNLITTLYRHFKETQENGLDSGLFELSYIRPRDSMPVMILEIVFAVIIIIYSKQFTDYFSKKITNRDAIDEIGSSVN